MKRLFLLFFSALLCTAVSAHDFEVDGIYYEITSSSELTVIVTYQGGSYNEYSDEYSDSVVIPEKVTYDSKEYSVTSIRGYAFYGCSGLTSVTIPNSVTSIGGYAFYGCSGLTSVTIPNSVTSIGNRAFDGCSGMTSVTIGNSVTSIGYSAFYGTGWYNDHSNGILYLDSWLIGYKGYKPTGTLEIKEGTRGIANMAFSSCKGLTSVTIPNSVTSIGNEAFSGCSGLLSVTIPNSVTSIGYSAFYGCKGLTSVTIPNSVTSIGWSAFYGCSGLTAVHITDLSAWCEIKFGDYDSNPASYAHHLYLNGEEIINLVIPDDVTTIGNYAFYDFSGLTSVTIPNSVTSIGWSAFYGCSGLTSVTIPNSVTNIGGYAFHGCSGLLSVTIPNSVTSIGDDAFRGCSGLASVTIPNSVTSIGDYAFRDCSRLTSVTIPNSVTSIGSYTFYGCSGLASVTIPNSVTSIGDCAFRDCSALTSVTIPNSVTSIGWSAFYGCSGLTSVTIPNSVTNIGGYAFNGCSGLASVTIPNSVTSIGEYAFNGCSGLKSLRFEDGESTLTFPDNFSNTIDSLYLGRNITSKSSYFNTGENNLSILSIGKHVISLDDKMFYNCSNITKVICYATEPPMIYPMTFYTDIYGKATLSVLGESMEKYRNADVWKKFSKIEEIDNNPNATEQCAAPVITYADGKLQFACETAGAECKYTLTAKDIQTAFITASNNSVDLTACYDITAYAVAEGYKNSEQVTATLYWINGSDVSTNINQTEMRGVMATCSGGIITVSGLTDGETVMFYDANGALLYTGTAQNGIISYAPSATGVIIVKIGTASIKVVN